MSDVKFSSPPAGGQSSFAQTQAPVPTVPGDFDALCRLVQSALDHRLIPPGPDLLERLRALADPSAKDEAQAVLADALAAGSAADRGLEAISPLFQPGDVIQITAIDPAGGGALSRNGDLSVPEDRAELANFVRQHIGWRNLYFGTNPRDTNYRGTGREAKADDVAARRTVFVDMDRKDAPDADPDWTRTREALEALGPVLLVETGNGFHAHFHIEVLTGEALAESVRPLADAQAHLGSDNVADLPRIARLPYTPNLPTASKRKRGAVPTLAVVAPRTNPPSDPRPIKVLCADFADVASRLSLQRKKPGTGASAASASRSGEKTGRPAPSADLLRIAMEELPNNGPFDDREDWIRLCHAVKGAAVAGGVEGEGRDIWLEWCARWNLGGDRSADTNAWDGIANTHTGWGTLMRLLQEHNPVGHENVKLRVAQAAFPPILAGFGLQPVQPFTPTDLPPRKWLYGRCVIAGYVSMLVAPGGTGKSALIMAEAVAMATGKTLLPEDKPHHPLRIWLHNAEDDLAEQKRRLEATLRGHGITHSDLAARLFFTSGRDLRLMLARQGRDGPEVNREAVEYLVEHIDQERIDVLILDPLGAMHTLPENSNEAANLLLGALREIAERTGAAIVLVHHTGKMAAKDMDAAGAGAARGASAYVDGARVVRQLRRAGPNDRMALGVAETELWQYVRVDNGKANLAPAGAACWLRLTGVSLGNGTPDYPEGDNVQTVTRWTPPSALPVAISDLQRVQEAINAAAHPPRQSTQAQDWVGHVAGEALGLDTGKGLSARDLSPDQQAARERVKGVLAHGMRTEALKLQEVTDPASRKKVSCVVAGVPAFAVGDECLPGSTTDAGESATDDDAEVIE